MSNFTILTNGRSGSTFMIRYLQSCPGTKIYGEVFHGGFLASWSGLKGGTERFKSFQKECCENPAKFLLKLGRGNGIKNVGSKTVTSEIGWDNVDNLLDNPLNVKIVFLYRKNILHRYLSAFYGNNIKKWHLTSEKDRRKIPPKKVDIEWLKDRINFERPKLRHIISKCKDKGYFMIEYEDLFNNFDYNMNKLLNFLCLEKPVNKPKNLTIKSVKDYSFVSNRNEVNRLFGQEFGNI